METTLAPRQGYDMEIIRFSGLRGKSSGTWLLLPLRLLLALWQSASVIRRVRPDVVLGMGGYPAFPGGMMASLLAKPLLIHEQNSIPGLANRILTKVADKVLLGFPGAIRNGGKVMFTGNPVRSEISQLPPPRERYASRSGRLKLLVIGGSLGAQALNTIVPLALKRIPGERATAGNASGWSAGTWKRSKKIMRKQAWKASWLHSSTIWRLDMPIATL